MRAFGKAKEVLNVTRILSGLPSKLTKAEDARSPDSITIEKDDLLELCVTVEEMRPHFQRLCKDKAKSMADKAKDAAEKMSKVGVCG